MLLLRYLEENTEHEISFEYINDNVCGIIGNIPIKEKGFLLKEPLENKSWETDAFDYSNYTTIYREMEGVTYFSNDGSIYEEPEIPEEPVEPYEPTIEEVRLNKFVSLKHQALSYIYTGVIYNEKQIYYEETEFKNKLEQSVQINLPVVFQSVSYTPDQMKELYVLLEDNKAHHSIYEEVLESYIKTIEDVNEIYELTYGMELKDEFLEEYERKFNDAREVTQKYVNQLGYANVGEMTSTQLGLAEAYEQGLHTEEKLTELQLAMCDIYELMLGGIE